MSTSTLCFFLFILTLFEEPGSPDLFFNPLFGKTAHFELQKYLYLFWSIVSIYNDRKTRKKL